MNPRKKSRRGERTGFSGMVFFGLGRRHCQRSMEPEISQMMSPFNGRTPPPQWMIEAVGPAAICRRPHPKVVTSPSNGASNSAGKPRRLETASPRNSQQLFPSPKAADPLHRVHLLTTHGQECSGARRVTKHGRQPTRTPKKKTKKQTAVHRASKTARPGPNSFFVGSLTERLAGVSELGVPGGSLLILSTSV